MAIKERLSSAAEVCSEPPDTCPEDGGTGITCHETAVTAENSSRPVVEPVSYETATPVCETCEVTKPDGAHFQETSFQSL